MKKLKKLKALTLDEIRVRGSQALAAFGERRELSSLGKLPADKTIDALLDNAFTGGNVSAEQFFEVFRSRTKPRFFAAFDDPADTVRQLRTTWPRAESEIIGRANRLVAGKFDLLGFKDLSFGSPIDWHLEPLSGKRAPLIHWSRLDYLNADLAGDKKIVWELNRHQYFSTLGQAYWLSGDEVYAETFVAHLESWMDQNPPKRGINWASSLEVSFRSISWLWALHFFKNSPTLTSKLFLRALKFLYLNARHLETYLSTYFSPNTHLTGEALGLFYLGTLLPELKPSSRWRKIGRDVLLDQLSRHVQIDGVYFEQSSYYHRYTTDFYTHFLALSQVNGDTVPGEVEKHLQLLLDHLMYITRPDGTTPLFGDDDGGRLMSFDTRAANDFRAALANGAALFGRGDYKFVAREPAEETLWLLGGGRLRDLEGLQSTRPAKESVAFKNSGYYVMRDSWEPEANYLLFDCGLHGTMNCGHAHADALAFEAVARGQTMLVDAGTYSYTGSRELRDWFRSSAGHNTLTVDGQSSSVPGGPFSWQSIAHAQNSSWFSNNRIDFVEGRHDGFQRLEEPVDQRRSILFLKRDYWVMRDHISSNGSHLYELGFHFESGPLIFDKIREHSIIARSNRAVSLEIAAFGQNGHWRKEEAWVSHCYGQKDPATAWVFSAEARVADFVTFLLPSDNSGIAGYNVREIEAVGGRAFEVASETFVDIVMVRSGARVETARLAGDSDWIWARFSADDAKVPKELVVIGGQRLELEGKEILNSARPISCLIATWLGDRFLIKTDDGVFESAFPILDDDSANSKVKSRV